MTRGQRESQRISPKCQDPEGQGGCSLRPRRKSSLTKHFSSQEVQVEQWADTSLGGSRGMQNHEDISEVTRENSL